MVAHLWVLTLDFVQAGTAYGLPWTTHLTGLAQSSP